MSNNIAILASTKGTDMQAVIEAIENNELDAEIRFVLSNKPDNYALERARNHNLKAIFLDPKGKTREEFDREVSRLIEEHDVSLILLIGYMKLMSNWFVDKYRNKVMNIHPSLLPMFAGGMDLNVHEEVLKRGCKVSGCSLIFIDEGADTGPIILQKTVPIESNETVDSLKEKVQKAEQDILIEGIKLYFDGKIKVEGNKVKILD
ncbi:phosphoribosylglycinamide formyltransferase [Candidatus Woesearchaeota archaeon]|nr:phosphoribosylglycinamide formyltransferase [Candidatus Woesearchaeota archaeon]